MRPRTLTSATLFVLALLLTACPGLLGQALGQEVPFTGVVNQNQTDVRAGAADRYYRVGELDKDTLVKVEQVIAGWNKIVPPEGFHSYISKAFVDAKGDGSTGVVNTDRSKVYAADVNGPAGSYRVQAVLNEFDEVRIVEEEGSHYKIVPPAEAYVYLPPGSVRRAMAMELEPEGTTPDPDPVVEPEPEPDPVVEPEPVVIPPVESDPVVITPVEPEPTVIEPEPTVVEPVLIVPVEPEPDPVDNTSDQALNDMLGDETATTPMTDLQPALKVDRLSLAELEKKVQAMRDLPVEERPLDETIAQYELLAAEGGLSQADQYRVNSRLALLRYEKGIAEGLIAIAKAREGVVDEPEAELEAVPYDAVGRLLASSVYDGQTLPRMYRLVDPATGKSLAYIKADAAVDTTGHLGKLVGIQGTTSYDPALKLKVIDVKHVDHLGKAD